MVVQFPCLVCNKAVAKNQRAVHCDLHDSWVHIACNNLNVYTYPKLQKASLPGSVYSVYEKSYHMGPLMILN